MPTTMLRFMQNKPLCDVGGGDEHNGAVVVQKQNDQKSNPRHDDKSVTDESSMASKSPSVEHQQNLEEPEIVFMVKAFKIAQDTRVGLELERKDNPTRIVVSKIHQGGLFENTALKVGHTIVRINGRTCPDAGNHPLWEAMDQIKCTTGILRIEAVGTITTDTATDPNFPTRRINCVEDDGSEDDDVHHQHDDGKLSSSASSTSRNTLTDVSSLCSSSSPVICAQMMGDDDTQIFRNKRAAATALAVTSDLDATCLDFLEKQIERVLNGEISTILHHSYRYGKLMFHDDDGDKVDDVPPLENNTIDNNSNNNYNNNNNKRTSRQDDVILQKSSSSSVDANDLKRQKCV